jgi:hypothetical protein
VRITIFPSLQLEFEHWYYIILHFGPIGNPMLSSSPLKLFLCWARFLPSGINAVVVFDASIHGYSAFVWFHPGQPQSTIVSHFAASDPTTFQVHREMVTSMLALNSLETVLAGKSVLLVTDCAGVVSVWQKGSSSIIMQEWALQADMLCSRW